MKIRLFSFWLGLLAASTPVIVVAASSPDHYLERAELKSFIETMVSRHGFEEGELKRLFADVEPRPDIIKAISHPAEAKPWHQYRPIFLTDARIEGGVEFWQAHHDDLARAEQTYGVPPEMVVAIIGVETRYGKYKGKYRVLDALSTLAFDYPKRSAFFTRELEQYLLLTREENIDPLSIKGSYAGAMGGPQFISSSYRHYAVDFDGDGKRDLWENVTDMIGSVANYFSVHGWRAGESVATPVSAAGKEPEKYLAVGLQPQHTVGQLRKNGIAFNGKSSDEQAAALIALDGENAKEYWLGFHNFYVITRYNRSELYAMAAYQLSREIAAQREKQLASIRESSANKNN